MEILVVLGKNIFQIDISEKTAALNKLAAFQYPDKENKNRNSVVNKHIDIVLHIILLAALFHSVASYLQLGSQTMKICWE